MKEPSEKRKRILELHDRALRFSNGVNVSCPKMGIALREAKESRACLMKIRMGHLDHFNLTADRDLESEAGQLAAIYASIMTNMRLRLAEEEKKKASRPRKPRTPDQKLETGN